MIWTRQQLDRRFTVDQVRFLDIKTVPGGYTVTTSGGQPVPPPAWTRQSPHWFDCLLSLLIVVAAIPCAVVAGVVEYGSHWLATR
jgi:hypothetical protein